VFTVNQPPGQSIQQSINFPTTKGALVNDVIGLDEDHAPTTPETFSAKCTLSGHGG
jgi:hypothetical protein